MVRKGSSIKIKRYKCKECGWIIANRCLHLQNYHDDQYDLYTINSMADNEDRLMELFEETEGVLTSKIYNYGTGKIYKK